MTTFNIIQNPFQPCKLQWAHSVGLSAWLGCAMPFDKTKRIAAFFHLSAEKRFLAHDIAEDISHKLYVIMKANDAELIVKDGRAYFKFTDTDYDKERTLRIDELTSKKVHITEINPVSPFVSTGLSIEW